MSTGFTIEDFKEVFSREEFELPVRWDGVNYAKTLREVFDFYCLCLSNLFYVNDSVREIAPNVKYICDTILDALKAYLNGKPSEAFTIFNQLFSEQLMPNQFSIYDELFDPSLIKGYTDTDKSRLFRVRKVGDNKTYGRKDIFHTPFNLRNKVATTRYSIAGYPSLYLSTSLELCLEELDHGISPGRYICSRFEMSKKPLARIIELGIKPKDFYLNSFDKMTKRQTLIHKALFNDQDTLKNYYLWFPLIIACSFIRINRSDPFGIEYVIPQLLMQSVRSFKLNGVFMGVRFFSCSSKHSSELGFNYVFPTNYSNKEEIFCPVLSKAFLVTMPCFLNEFKDVSECEDRLMNATTASIWEREAY